MDKGWIADLKEEVSEVKTYAMGDEFFDVTEEALGVYDSYKMDRDFFEDWMINAYYVKDQQTIYDLYKQQNEGLVVESYYSIFKVIEKKEKVVLKDIFTKEDYPVTTFESFGEGLVSGRIYKTQKGYAVIDKFLEINESLEKRIIELVFNQYNQYCVQFETIDLKRFIQLNDLFVMKLQDTVLEVEQQVVADGIDYTAYQAKYVINTLVKPVVELLVKHPSVKRNDDFEEVYAIYFDDQIIAEVEIEDKALYIITNDQDTLITCKGLIESTIGEYLTFVSDYELSLDDLL